MAQATTKEAWLQFADELLAVGFSILGEAQITETEKGAADPRVVAATLLIRTLSNFRGRPLWRALEGWSKRASSRAAVSRTNSG